MDTSFFGIDPGQTGAIALIANDGEVGVYDYEDSEALLLIKHWWQSPLFGALEKITYIPGNSGGKGGQGTLNFGKNIGIWMGRLEALGIPYIEVPPLTWHKHFFGVRKKGTVVDTKERSLALARKAFPTMALKLMRQKDHNRAEALLLALYAKQTYEEKQNDQSKTKKRQMSKRKRKSS